MNAAVPLLAAEQQWECGACDATHVTALAVPHAPMHQCKGMRGLLVPYVPAGSRVKVTAAEREDYIGGELVQLDGDGRPVMSVTVEDDDHADAVVYAPLARGAGLWPGATARSSRRRCWTPWRTRRRSTWAATR